MPLRILRFNETATGVTYTARTNIPKGARLIDVFCETSAAWAANGAPVDVGDSDGADSLVAAYDLVNIGGVNVEGGNPGSGWPTNGGPYSDGGVGKLYPAGDTITCVITADTPAGPATGISSVVLWFEPQGAGQLASVTV